jgi:hypothetical protein
MTKNLIIKFYVIFVGQSSADSEFFPKVANNTNQKCLKVANNYKKGHQLVALVSPNEGGRCT